MSGSGAHVSTPSRSYSFAWFDPVAASKASPRTENCTSWTCDHQGISGELSSSRVMRLTWCPSLHSQLRNGRNDEFIPPKSQSLIS